MKCPHCLTFIDDRIIVSTAARINGVKGGYKGPMTEARSEIYRQNALKRWAKRFPGEAINKREHIKRKESK